MTDSNIGRVERQLLTGNGKMSPVETDIVNGNGLENEQSGYSSNLSGVNIDHGAEIKTKDRQDKTLLESNGNSTIEELVTLEIANRDQAWGTLDADTIAKIYHDAPEDTKFAIRHGCLQYRQELLPVLENKAKELFEKLDGLQLCGTVVLGHIHHLKNAQDNVYKQMDIIRKEVDGLQAKFTALMRQEVSEPQKSHPQYIETNIGPCLLPDNSDRRSPSSHVDGPSHEHPPPTSVTVIDHSAAIHAQLDALDGPASLDQIGEVCALLREALERYSYQEWKTMVEEISGGTKHSMLSPEAQHEAGIGGLLPSFQSGIDNVGAPGFDNLAVLPLDMRHERQNSTPAFLHSAREEAYEAEYDSRSTQSDTWFECAISDAKSWEATGGSQFEYLDSSE